MFKYFHLRALRKTGLLGHFNFSKQITFGGVPVRIPVVNGLGYPNIFLKPNWLLGIVHELFASGTGAFLDVGANVGQTLVAVKSVNKKIPYIGFEPNPSCVFYLKKLVKENHFENVKLLNIALSNKPQQGVLETNVEGDPTASIVHDLRPSFFSQQELVFAYPFDNLGFHEEVKCVKIDVEGGELEVLAGMLNLIRDSRPYIICEVLDSFSKDVLKFTQDRAGKLSQLLHQSGYSIIQLIQNEDTDRIVSFFEIGSITIQSWTQESVMKNDYIFFPDQNRAQIICILQKLSALTAQRL